MKINCSIIFMTIILFTTSCVANKVYSEKNVSMGVFVGSESKERIILMLNQEFYYLSPKGSLFDESNSIDTLSYGKWEVDGAFLILNSSEKILDQYLHAEIEERKIPNQDSIIVEINCPFEKELDKSIVTTNNKYFVESRPYYYSVSFESNNAGFSSMSSFRRGGNIIKYAKNNELTKVVGDLLIKSLSVTIIPDNFNYPGHIAYKLIQAGYYEVKDKSSNYFKISIPDFTSKYLNYRRFNGEYIKVNKKNQLIWNNEMFIKE